MRLGAFKRPSVMGAFMNIRLCAVIFLLSCLWGVSQVTPRRFELKPTEDETALKGAATYWIDESPVVNRRILEDTAAKLEKDLGVKPALTREDAGMVLVFDYGSEWSNAFGILMQREYQVHVYVQGVYIWRFGKTISLQYGEDVQTVSYALGWHIVKKWKKANK